MLPDGKRVHSHSIREVSDSAGRGRGACQSGNVRQRDGTLSAGTADRDGLTAVGRVDLSIVGKGQANGPVAEAIRRVDLETPFLFC
jgi:hypothetical protein